jgi:hypothetical protein
LEEKIRTIKELLDDINFIADNFVVSSELIHRATKVASTFGEFATPYVKLEDDSLVFRWDQGGVDMELAVKTDSLDLSLFSLYEQKMETIVNARKVEVDSMLKRYFKRR